MFDISRNELFCAYFIDLFINKRTSSSFSIFQSLFLLIIEVRNEFLLLLKFLLWALLNDLSLSYSHRLYLKSFIFFLKLHIFFLRLKLFLLSNLLFFNNLLFISHFSGLFWKWDYSRTFLYFLILFLCLVDKFFYIIIDLNINIWRILFNFSFLLFCFSIENVFGLNIRFKMRVIEFHIFFGKLNFFICELFKSYEFSSLWMIFLSSLFSKFMLSFVFLL